MPGTSAPARRPFRTRARARPPLAQCAEPLSGRETEAEGLRRPPRPAGGPTAAVHGGLSEAAPVAAEGVGAMGLREEG